MTFYVTVAGGGVAPIALDGGTDTSPTNVYARRLAGGVINVRKDGIGSGAGFRGISTDAIAAFRSGALVLSDNNVLRRYSPADGMVKTIANLDGVFNTASGGNGYNTQFPSNIESIYPLSDSAIVFTAGNQIWAGSGPFGSDVTADPDAFTFFRIGGAADNSNGTAMGDGNTARFSEATAIVLDPSSGFLYIADQFNDRIVRGRKIQSSEFLPSSWRFEVVAGTGVAGFADGSALIAQFTNPDGLAIGDDRALYIADNGNKRLRRMDLNTNTVTTVAGDGTDGRADGTPGQFQSIRSLASDGAGSIYLYDNFGLRVFRNGRLYTISPPSSGGVQDGFVDGPGQSAITRIAVNPATGTIYSVAAASGGTPALVAFEAVVP